MHNLLILSSLTHFLTINFCLCFWRGILVFLILPFVLKIFSHSQNSQLTDFQYPINFIYTKV